RADRRRTTFGKAFAGQGENDRYQGGGNLNVLRGPTRFSVIGLANNVNQQNFSAQDLLGVRGGLFGGGSGRRVGGGGPFGDNLPGGGRGTAAFLVGTQDGVTTTNALGAHLNASAWGNHLSLSQSYFFNDADNDNLQDLSRLYSVPQDSVAS